MNHQGSILQQLDHQYSISRQPNDDYFSPDSISIGKTIDWLTLLGIQRNQYDQTTILFAGQHEFNLSKDKLDLNLSIDFLHTEGRDLYLNRFERGKPQAQVTLQRHSSSGAQAFVLTVLLRGMTFLDVFEFLECLFYGCNDLALPLQFASLTMTFARELHLGFFKEYFPMAVEELYPKNGLFCARRTSSKQKTPNNPFISSIHTIRVGHHIGNDILRLFHLCLWQCPVKRIVWDDSVGEESLMMDSFIALVDAFEDADEVVLRVNAYSKAAGLIQSIDFCRQSNPKYNVPSFDWLKSDERNDYLVDPMDSKTSAKSNAMGSKTSVEPNAMSNKTSDECIAINSKTSQECKAVDECNALGSNAMSNKTSDECIAINSKTSVESTPMNSITLVDSIPMNKPFKPIRKFSIINYGCIRTSKKEYDCLDILYKLQDSLNSSPYSCFAHIEYLRMEMPAQTFDGDYMHRLFPNLRQLDLILVLNGDIYTDSVIKDFLQYETKRNLVHYLVSNGIELGIELKVKRKALKFEDLYPISTINQQQGRTNGKKPGTTTNANTKVGTSNTNIPFTINVPFTINAPGHAKWNNQNEDLNEPWLKTWNAYRYHLPLPFPRINHHYRNIREDYTFPAYNAMQLGHSDVQSPIQEAKRCYNNIVHDLLHGLHPWIHRLIFDFSQTNMLFNLILFEAIHSLFDVLPRLNSIELAIAPEYYGRALPDSLPDGQSQPIQLNAKKDFDDFWNKVYLFVAEMFKHQKRKIRINGSCMLADIEWKTYGMNMPSCDSQAVQQHAVKQALSSSVLSKYFRSEIIHEILQDFIIGSAVDTGLAGIEFPGRKSIIHY